MKVSWQYILALFVVVTLFFFVLLNQSGSDRIMKDLLDSESKKRKEINELIEEVKRDREELQKEIEALKEEIRISEQKLNNNIATIKLKTNVQVRNLSDSTNAALLRDLLPK